MSVFVFGSPSNGCTCFVDQTIARSSNLGGGAETTNDAASQDQGTGLIRDDRITVARPDDDNDEGRGEARTQFSRAARSRAAAGRVARRHAATRRPRSSARRAARPPRRSVACGALAACVRSPATPRRTNGPCRSIDEHERDRCGGLVAVKRRDESYLRETNTTHRHNTSTQVPRRRLAARR